MKRFAAIVWIVLFGPCAAGWAQSGDEADGPVRIACVGDSITFGAGLPERQRWSYPALLDAMLGEGYDVGNFGVSGATLLSDGDKPYVKERVYQDALAFEPNVVVLMLGTNDTKAHNWKGHRKFEADYRALVQSFNSLKSKPRIIAMVPVPAWTQGDQIDAARVKDELAPRVRAVARRQSWETIDLQKAMQGKKAWFPDGVHPISFGTEFIAKRVYERIVAQPGQVDATSVNFAAISMPGTEYRGGPAGWGGGTWWNQHENINQLGMDRTDIDLVFLGDSITQSWTGSHRRYGGGKLGQHFGQYKAASFGISGDRTEHLLYRIANGNFKHIDPKLIVLMIGVNNLNSGYDGKQTAEGIHAIVNTLRQREPQAHLLVLGCFPTGRTKDAPKRLEVNAVHEGIATIGDSDDKVTYRDLRSIFLNPDGSLNGNMRGDAVHITGKGYDAWAKAIAPDVQAVLGE